MKASNLLPRYDGHMAGHLTADKLSTRNLQSITCQVLLAQKSLLQLLLEKMDTDYGEWSSNVKTATCLNFKLEFHCIQVLFTSNSFMHSILSWQIQVLFTSNYIVLLLFRFAVAVMRPSVMHQQTMWSFDRALGSTLGVRVFNSISLF